MKFQNVEQAVRILTDERQESSPKIEAIFYLQHFSDPAIADSLVCALQDDHLGVRWEAAKALARMGRLALPAVLNAMTHPHRVSDRRLREGILHVFRENSDPLIRAETHTIVEAVHGPAADILAMETAGALLRKFHVQWEEKPC